jgi:hypothetical protein
MPRRLFTVRCPSPRAASSSRNLTKSALVSSAMGASASSFRLSVSAYLFPRSFSFGESADQKLQKCARSGGYARNGGIKRIFSNWVNKRNSISSVSTHSRKPYRRDLLVSDMISYSILKMASPKGQETAASKE